jgi:Carbohydrate esterase, sialic acid-specific acetylesterase
MKVFIFAGVACLLAGLNTQAASRPLKVYILAGQSNMQGQGHVCTFSFMGLDPQTAPILEKIVDKTGVPRLIKHVWISSLGTGETEKYGQLTTGYGSERRSPKIGPELTFGIYMQEHLAEPILLIKTAWGGKNLYSDFRPPSAGIHPAHARRMEEIKKKGQEVRQSEAEYAERTGKYYRAMIGHVKSVLGDIKRVVPDYDPAQGYEVAGFVWLQGCSDFGEKDTYPNPAQPGGFDEYSRLLCCMIRDIRIELGAPEMCAVIGVIGINGELDTERVRDIEPQHIPWLREFRKAMAAPAAMPEFKGKVAAVYTEKFWEPRLEELQFRWKKVKEKSGELRKAGLGKDEQKIALDAFMKTVYTPEEAKLMEVGVSNATYHYLGSAKIMARMGKAFAEAMADMEKRSKKITCNE